MPSEKKIEDLVYLLDAESPAVRGAVARELLNGKHDLEGFLAEASGTLKPEVLFQIHDLLRSRKNDGIRRNWTDWLVLEDPFLQLEAAFSFLADLQGTGEDARPLSEMLDHIVRDFLEHEVNPGAMTLNRFLFEEKRFTGNTRDYYHPANSNLRHVLATGKGLPISLACIFILCGSRLALEITGFNMRGHFLAKCVIRGKPHLFDCFNDGRIYSGREMRTLARSDPEEFRSLMDNPAKPAEIICRVLNNLTHAYSKTGDLEGYHLVQDLLSDLQARMVEEKARTRIQPPEFRGSTLFVPGQLVRHKRYGYRGVVVALDMSCKAGENWYRANRTQPDRQQPWYHVLVDRSNLATYAAQSSLDADDSEMEIQHPLVPLFFEHFLGNRYARNDVPWILPG